MTVLFDSLFVVQDIGAVDGTRVQDLWSDVAIFEQRHHRNFGISLHRSAPFNSLQGVKWSDNSKSRRESVMATDPNVHTGMKSVNLTSKIWSFLKILKKLRKKFEKNNKKKLAPLH